MLPSLAELLWNAVHRVDVPDDQVKMNRALDSFHIVWDKRNSTMTNSPWHGRGSSNLTVTILPMNWVCRGHGACQKRSVGAIRCSVELNIVVWGFCTITQCSALFHVIQIYLLQFSGNTADTWMPFKIKRCPFIQKSLLDDPYKA